MSPDTSVETVGNDRVVVAGDVDAANVAHIREAVLAVLAVPAGEGSAATAPPGKPGSDAGALVLDLRGVGFMASAGLALLLDLDARAFVSGRPLVMVVEAGGAVARQLTRTGLDSQLAVRPTDRQNTDEQDTNGE